jgi:hypothetical protein
MSAGSAFNQLSRTSEPNVPLPPVRQGQEIEPQTEVQVEGDSTPGLSDHVQEDDSDSSLDEHPCSRLTRSHIRKQFDEMEEIANAERTAAVDNITEYLDLSEDSDDGINTLSSTPAVVGVASRDKDSQVMVPNPPILSFEVG